MTSAVSAALHPMPLAVEGPTNSKGLLPVVTTEFASVLLSLWGPALSR
jgi:hypothetical protein